MENTPYELELLPIKIGKNMLELYTVKRWKEAIETGHENEDDYIRNFPLWIKIWEAAIVLTEDLTRREIDADSKILELGAGMGLTGLALGSMGYHVTLTDTDETALALLEKNVKHNQLTTARIQKLDWFHPNTEEQFDVICGSELIYKDEAVEPLLNLLLHILKKEGTAYIAHDVNRNTMTTFLEKASRFFKIESHLKSLKGKDISYKIAIHILKFK